MLKRKRHESEELELTTLLNILVVLVSFLLLSAVFSKITIQELNMPPQASGPAEPRLQQACFVPFLVKVVNQGAVRAPLRITNQNSRRRTWKR